MLLHNDIIYPPDHLDMDAKLDLILKELKDLKLKVDGLKNKSIEETLENRNDMRMDGSISRLKINE